MTNSTATASARRQDIFAAIEQFESAYDYDASYMRDLYERSPAAFGLFDAARRMAAYFDALPAAAHFVAAITVMQHEDCGPCLRLNEKLAVEAGVRREVLDALAAEPAALPAELQDVRSYTTGVLSGQVDEAVAARIESQWGPAALAELAIGIVGARMYPTIKRALLKAGVCELPRVS